MEKRKHVVQVGNSYTHYAGKRYEVTSLAKHSETLEDFAVCMQIPETKEEYDNPARNYIAVPLTSFYENATVNGKTAPKFKNNSIVCGEGGDSEKYDCGCLKWIEKERVELGKKILKLSNDQIIDLFDKVGISYYKKGRKFTREEMQDEIISYMRAEQDPKEYEEDMYMETLLNEANSKQELRKWLEYFEEKND